MSLAYGDATERCALNTNWILFPIVQAPVKNSFILNYLASFHFRTSEFLLLSFPHVTLRLC